ncbi:sugar ABC transporter ATP-binding protein [Miniphocaeibacter halophilus]|uniref:Sugar ABC transporter ATP-binding protein n=1 Tax=Miniphocaeibacter halophilus TaxID=2931922 RepID=A0AC61MUA7_9FIRM|nr:sugar ABC transporter ATP-binding protein [Miniphocaeibacter halophilus]QQK07788.1 sugar ABC transporter ATP-binding protein [Miniphocaeibacter halophilus]
MERKIILEMKNIEKSFPGVKALKNVDFSVAEGEVHALMGENGAGKSTLIKVLTGVYGKDSGDIMFQGKSINPKSTLEAQEEGISTIYQELNLSPFQTVYENIYLGREIKNKYGSLDRKQMRAGAKELLSDMGLHIDVDVPLRKYSTAIQQMVAIARAVSTKAKLVIMDEPTSSLDTKEVRVLFDVINRLKSQGIAIIFISHRLDEVFEICGHVTILKDGELVGDYSIEDLDQMKLVSLMIGREAVTLERKKDKYTFRDVDELVKMEDIHFETKLNGIGISIKKGEVLGLAGLLGSGRTELANVLFGEIRPDKGNIYWLDKKVSLKNPQMAIKLGMGFCTEDRKVEGIFPEMTVKENMTVALLPQISKHGIISNKKEEELTQYYIDKLRIKTPSMDQLIGNLSGGNQQKVLLARWMCMNPDLIIMDEPTRGIDVGAKSEIEDLIQELSSNGISILMISSEIEELERNCDRVYVMREGKELADLIEDDINSDLIMSTIASAGKVSSKEGGK